MKYSECLNDFYRIEIVRTSGGGIYHFQRLNSFETSLTTPCLIGLFKPVEIRNSGAFHTEIVECIFQENPSEYLKTIDKKEFEFVALMIDQVLDDCNISSAETNKAISELKAAQFYIRADRKIQPINLQ